jgi:hypothetical protein
LSPRFFYSICYIEVSGLGLLKERSAGFECLGDKLVPGPIACLGDPWSFAGAGGLIAIGDGFGSLTSSLTGSLTGAGSGLGEIDLADVLGFSTNLAPLGTFLGCTRTPFF